MQWSCVQFNQRIFIADRSSREFLSDNNKNHTNCPPASYKQLNNYCLPSQVQMCSQKCAFYAAVRSSTNFPCTFENKSCRPSKSKFPLRLLTATSLLAVVVRAQQTSRAKTRRTARTAIIYRFLSVTRKSERKKKIKEQDFKKSSSELARICLRRKMLNKSEEPRNQRRQSLKVRNPSFRQSCSVSQINYLWV